MNSGHKWDAFVSHASEDKEFVERLVGHLEDWGLRVWYDAQVLQPGDSLRRKIDDGLASSRYGIVVLSNNFFAKEWPKKELDGLMAREDGEKKVIIPVWHNVSSAEVRQYSPILADRLSVLSSSEPDCVAEKIVNAIYSDELGSVKWKPLYHILPDGSEVAIMQAFPVTGYAIGLATNPVSNAQYRKFCDATSHPIPIGENFVGNTWKGPFIPWDNGDFSDDAHPVTCVALKDAGAYCEWITRLSPRRDKETRKRGYDYYLQRRDSAAMAFVPTKAVWEWAAFGSADYRSLAHRRAVTRRVPNSQRQLPKCLVRVDEAGERRNVRGVSDIFGNVWEWGFEAIYQGLSLTSPRGLGTEVVVRGGGYLDNLSKIRVILSEGVLPDGRKTLHSDLGFRVAVLIDVRLLSRSARLILSSQPRLGRDDWLELMEAVHYMQNYFG